MKKTVLKNSNSSVSTWKLIFIFVLGLSSLNLMAQRDQTLFNKSGRIGLFVSTGAEFGNKNTGLNSAATGGAAFVLGDIFLGGYGTAGAAFDELIWDEDINRIDLAHGGLWLGFNTMQHKMIHPFASVKVGWGAVDIDVDRLEDFEFDENDWTIRDNDALDNVFVTTPEIGLELNITRFLRVSGSVGYRFVNGVNASNYEKDAFNDVMGNVSLKLGWFGRDKERKSWYRRW